jgi:hypothetical protein
MARLSDRAFQIIRAEIERRYQDESSDPIERVILLARLETLRSRPGKPMTRVEIWEELSDVLPNIDQNVLMAAESIDTDSPVMGASLGVGAVAVLIAAAVGMDSMAASSASAFSPSPNVRTANKSVKPTAQDPLDQGLLAQAPIEASAAQSDVIKTAGSPTFSHSAGNSTARQPLAKNWQTLKAISNIATNSLPRPERQTITIGQPITNAFEMAKKLGWQAALKGQNAPHTAEHWGETAALWRQALEQLNQVKPQDADYLEAQRKKAFYQENLKEIQDRQAMATPSKGIALKQAIPKTVQAAVQTSASQSSDIARLATPSTQPSPQFSPQPSSQPAPQASRGSGRGSVQAAQDPIKVAKHYGWQAALASQNAPHPPEKWADISRLWQTALGSLNTINSQHPSYHEAQKVKNLYQKNLNEIRRRHQSEQAATQQLRALQADLSKINSRVSNLSQAAKYEQLKAVVSHLDQIPAGTHAHIGAQLTMMQTTDQLAAIAAQSNKRVILTANE